MKNKTFISRALVFIMTIVMMFTILPPNLIANALGGIGGGFSGNGGSGGGVGKNDSLLNHEVGLRFSLVTLKDGKRTVVETNNKDKYFIDVWCDGTDLGEKYSRVTGDTRYATESGEAVTVNNVLCGTSWNITSKVNTWLNTKFKPENVKTNFAMEHILFDGDTSTSGAVFVEYLSNGSYAFKVNGSNFYAWAMRDTDITVNGERIPNMEAFLKCFYSNKLRSLNLKETFLTVEPIIYYADLVSTGWGATGNKSVSSAYGYIRRQQARGYDPGRAYAIHGRLAKVVNGFCFGTETDNEVLTSLKKVLGLAPPTKESDYYHEGSSTFDFGGRMDSIGLGIQAFWLDSMSAPSGSPIDTFDIETNKPNVPYYPENPKDENKTTGKKTIIKLYADLYKDPNSKYYTQIVDIKNGDSYSFVRNNVSDKVTITDEQPINGYKATAWYLSNKNYPEASSEDNAMLKASNMISTSNIAETDGTVNLSQLGGSQLRINQYEAAYKDGIGYNADGGQRYFTGLASPHGANGNGLDVQQTAGASQYYGYKRLEVSGTSNYSNGQEYSLYRISKAVRAFIFLPF